MTNFGMCDASLSGLGGVSGVLWRSKSRPPHFEDIVLSIPQPYAARGPIHDIQRDQRIHDIANAGNEPDKPGEPKAKAAGKDEGVVHPPRKSFDIGKAWSISSPVVDPAPDSTGYVRLFLGWLHC